MHDICHGMTYIYRSKRDRRLGSCGPATSPEAGDRAPNFNLRWSRQFLAFREAVTREAGVTPQQYQALLVIKTHADGLWLTVKSLLGAAAPSGCVDRQGGVGEYPRVMGAEHRVRLIMGTFRRVPARRACA